jgi:hypothetical protein
MLQSQSRELQDLDVDEHLSRAEMRADFRKPSSKSGGEQNTSAFETPSAFLGTGKLRYL